MYGYTMHVPAPIESYQALHRAVMEVSDDRGGVDGLILHLVHATDAGYDLTEVWQTKAQLDAFNRDVFPEAAARAGVPMDGPPPAAEEFEPAAVVTTSAFATAT